MSTDHGIDLLISICEDYFQQRGYNVARGSPLHAHIRWRPNIYAKRNDENIAVDVRLTDSIPKFFRDILQSAKRLLPDIKIYIATPAETKFQVTYEKQTKSLGIGLFLIDGNLLQEKVRPRKPRQGDFVLSPSGKKVKAIILKPKSRFAAWVEIGEVFSNANRYVKFLDPYCDEKTLEHLLHVDNTLEIKLITSFSTKRRFQEKIFVAACQQFKMDYPKFEAQKCDPKKIHDRFLVTENEVWMIGPSVKDAGFKFGCIARIDDAQARDDIEKHFDTIWNDANSIPLV